MRADGQAYPNFSRPISDGARRYCIDLERLNFNDGVVFGAVVPPSDITRHYIVSGTSKLSVRCFASPGSTGRDGSDYAHAPGPRGGAAVAVNIDRVGTSVSCGRHRKAAPGARSMQTAIAKSRVSSGRYSEPYAMDLAYRRSQASRRVGGNDTSSPSAFRERKALAIRT